VRTTDSFCGTNLLVRAQQALVVDHLQFGRFEELCSFLELLVLSDEIYYLAESPLPGKLAHTFPLVLSHLDSEDVEHLVETTSLEYAFNEILKRVLQYSAPALSVKGVVSKGRKQRLDDDLILDYRNQIVQHSSDGKNGIFDWLVQLPKENGCFGVEARYFFRTFLYEALGSTLKVSVVHDGLRVPLAMAAELTSMRTNLLLYWALARALGPELSKNELRMYLRPIPAVILSRCEGDRSQILQHAAEIREHFRGYRESLLEFESLQQSPASLADKQKSVDLLGQSLQLLVEKARVMRGSKAWLKTFATRFYDTIRKSPVSFIPESALVGTATELLKASYDWDIKCQLASLFGLTEELAQIQSYPQFIETLWPSTPFARAHPFHRLLDECRNPITEPL